jgi:hypothetical protein
MRDVRVVIFNQTGDEPGYMGAADLPQRIKGRNPNVIELLVRDHFLKRLNAVV